MLKGLVAGVILPGTPAVAGLPSTLETARYRTVEKKARSESGLKSIFIGGDIEKTGIVCNAFSHLTNFDFEYVVCVL
jgi:hypothetical protein